jgi:hypothetical protein
MSEASALTAVLAFDVPSGKDVVLVQLGDEVIAKLEPIRESDAGDGDDSSFFLEEERSIAIETVAPILAHMFDKAMGELGYE